MLAAFVLWSAVALAGEVRVDVVDVGQGDSILIRTPAEKTILIDTGDRGSGIVPKLRELGVDHLDLVVATHPHADHIGEMPQVLQSFPVKLYTDNGLPHTTQVYTTTMATLEERGIAYRQAEVGQVYTLDDGAKLEVLFPNGVHLTGTRSDLNANSVVTRLTHGEDCILFVGDAEEPTERALLSQGLGACEVLKVAHHGSNHSSSPAFLRAVEPRLALISVGEGNRYGHPGEETLARLQGIGAEVHRTDLEDTLTLWSTGKGVRLESTHLATDGVAPPAPRVATPLPGAGQGPLPTRPLPAPAVAEPMDGPQPAAEPAPTPPARPPSVPLVAASGAPAATPAAACPYYASSSSEVFHEAECGNVARIKPENLTCYATREAAVAAGKRAAGCCHP